MKDTTVGCFLVIALLVAAVMFSLFLLVWGGVLRVGDTIIQRQVVIHSQQYITSHNDHILSLIRDYESVTASDGNANNRRVSIVNQVCSEASEITHDEQSTPVQNFVVVHCH